MAALQRPSAGNSFFICLFSLVIFVVATPAFASAAELIPLAEAERLAVERDPIIAKLGQKADALNNEAVVAGELPDPMVSVGAANFPTDTFDYEQEAMTQVQIGVQQNIPAWRSLSLGTERFQKLSSAERAAAEDRRLAVLRDARTAWFEVQYGLRSLMLLAESRQVMRDFIASIQSIYATGRRNTQYVLSAELELTLLEDRTLETERQLDVARAELAKFVGEDKVFGDYSGPLPELQAVLPRDQLMAELSNHPWIRSAQAEIDAAETDVSLAETSYLPKVSLGASYGFRGDDAMGRDRADLATVRLGFSVPIRPGARQDRKVAAKRGMLKARQFARDDRLRELVRRLDRDFASWQVLEKRVSLFADEIKARASDSVDAAEAAYRTDASDFATLLRAQTTEIETRLKELRVAINYAKAQVRLLYLQGETSS